MSSPKNSNPFFGVDLDLNNVGVEVRVNDIPIYFDDERGQLTVELPTPENIIDGSNDLSVSLSLPFDGDNRVEKFDPNAYISASLFRQNETNGVKKKLAHLKLLVNESGDFEIIDSFPKDQKAELILSRNGARANINVAIKSPFNQWQWENGKTIENNDKNFNSLLEVYKDIHRNFKSKNHAEIKRYYRNRAIEIAFAYGLAGEDAGHEKISTGKDMTDAALQLYDLHLDGAALEVLGNGKLARIKDEDNVQPIFFYDPKAGLLHLHKFLFYLNKSGEWVMIR